MSEAKVSDDVRAAAEQLVRQAMGRFGLRRVSVEPGRDHDGDPVIYIDAEYANRGDPIDTRTVAQLIDSVSSRLVELGEVRFPHIRHHFSERQKIARRR